MTTGLVFLNEARCTNGVFLHQDPEHTQLCRSTKQCTRLIADIARGKNDAHFHALGKPNVARYEYLTLFLYIFLSKLPVIVKDPRNLYRSFPNNVCILWAQPDCLRTKLDITVLFEPINALLHSSFRSMEASWPLARHTLCGCPPSILSESARLRKASRKPIAGTLKPRALRGHLHPHRLTPR